MPMFVRAADRIPISVDGGVNVIEIKKKLDFGTRQDVLTASAQLGNGEGGASLNFGEFEKSLMINFIVGWSGPEFLDEAGQPVPCTPENILSLDSDEPLVSKVIEEVNDRVGAKPSPDPKAAATTGSVSVGPASLEENLVSAAKAANSSHKRRATTTPMSSLRGS